jgi:DNA invertase Pin-like site-specific DNA recombinase
MVATAQAAAGTLTAAEPVPVGVAIRTSTGTLQDAVASYRRQLRACAAWLPAGWFIAAVYADVESGATDLEARSQGDAHRVLTDAGLRRDGGMADLLAEAAGPSPRFAVVVCEDIERSARDTFNALKLEKELSRNGIPLFATDEPADIAGVNSTTVLVRRVKQGVAEWYRLKLRESTWKGFIEHNAAGWNIGVPPYGYAAERHPHPSPIKASQGRTKTRLITDPDRKPVVEAIFQWRTADKLGVPTITNRLNASPAAYPPPGGGWTVHAVRVILANPKYTGHQVFGRRRTRDRRRYHAPADQWLWTPEPVHETIIEMGTWKAAQDIGAEHGTSRDHRDDAGPNPAGRTYPYRGRVRCRDCKKRMAANPFPAYVYYRCPHNPANPRHQAAAPGHPRTVQAPETVLDRITGQFFRDRVFTPGRAALLATQLPASDADAAGRRDHAAAALTAQVKKLDAQQAAQIRALEDVPDGPAGKAMRARINERFTQLHTDRTNAEAQLAALTTERPKAADPAILDEVPYAGDLIPNLPPDIKARLFAAFDLAILWNKDKAQATVTVTITDATLAALPEILNPGQPGYHDTAAEEGPESMGVLACPPITGPLSQPSDADRYSIAVTALTSV